MNADGSPGVSADITAGAKIPWVLWAGIGLALFGGLLLALGGWVIYRGTGGGIRQTAAVPAAAL